MTKKFKLVPPTHAEIDAFYGWEKPPQLTKAVWDALDYPSKKTVLSLVAALSLFHFPFPSHTHTPTPASSPHTTLTEFLATLNLGETK